jgi:hypothetical protein
MRWYNMMMICEVLTDALIMFQGFWDMIPRQLVCRYQCFRGDCFLQLQGACNQILFTNWHGIIPQMTWFGMRIAIISFTWIGKVCILLWISHHITDFVVNAYIYNLMTIIASTWQRGTDTGSSSSTLAFPSQCHCTNAPFSDFIYLFTATRMMRVLLTNTFLFLTGKVKAPVRQVTLHALVGQYQA